MLSKARLLRVTPSQGSLTSPRLRPAPGGRSDTSWPRATPQVQGSNTVTTPVAVQAGEARVLSLSLNRQRCRSLSVSILVKKPPFKAAAQFPFPLGYLSPHLSRGCSKNSSDKAMPCCFQQGGRASDRGSATCTGCGAGTRERRCTGRWPGLQGGPGRAASSPGPSAK